MNRILFEKGEIAGDTVTFGGVRAEHVLGILHGEVGQTLKTGELDGFVGESVITDIARDAAGAPTVTVKVSHDRAAAEPWIDLVLAPPRPRVLKRLLPQLAAMGVGTIVLVGAKKVEKDFWGATLLKEEVYRPILVEGLMQAGTTRVPRILPRRKFRTFLKDELAVRFPSGPRLVAHPSAAANAAPVPCPACGSRPLLAIGPEGGWTDDEVALLESLGFARYSLGARILRTDTATIALLARLSAVYETSL